MEVHDVRLCHGEGLPSWLFCFFLWLLVLLIFVILSSNVEYVGETHVKSTGLKFIEFVQRAQKVVYSMPYCNIMYILSVLCSHVVSILTPATVAPDQNDLRCKLLLRRNHAVLLFFVCHISRDNILLRKFADKENNHKMPHFPGFPWLLLPLSWSVILNREESALQTALAPWRKSLCWNVVLLDNSKVAN